MISVVTWKWGNLFGPEYVNRLRSMVERNLHTRHKIICVTDDREGIDPRVEIVPLPPQTNEAAHCSVRMRQFDPVWASFNLGERFLLIDLDVVIVNDITSIVERAEPLVCWWVEYAKMYAGGMILMNADALSRLWDEYRADPIGYSNAAKGWPGGSRDGSDQDMLNYYIAMRGVKPGRWTGEDGLIAPYGEARRNYRPANGWRRVIDTSSKVKGRTKVEMIPNTPFDGTKVAKSIPEGARIVFVGHRDKGVMDEAAHSWIAEHWR